MEKGGIKSCEALGRSDFEIHPFLTEREDIHSDLQISISKNLALSHVAALPLAARDLHGSEPCSVTQRKKMVMVQCNPEP